jgi:predicted double-glycine peptidase
MNWEYFYPWLETIGVILLAVAGAWAGRICSRLKPPYWAIGYIIPLLFIVSIALARRISFLNFVFPFSWIMLDRNEFALFAFACALLFATVVPHLRRKREKIFVSIGMALCIGYMSVLPFIMPALMRSYFANLITTCTPAGVCLQSNDYTCGPAAAVTALRKLGLDAEEGEIAILAHTNPTVGTSPDSLAYAINKRYGTAGIRAEFRPFDSVDELKTGGFTLAIVKHAFLIDHFVTILEVREDAVIVGDPTVGQKVYSREIFERIWRFVGVVLRRQN